MKNKTMSLLVGSLGVLLLSAFMAFPNSRTGTLVGNPLLLNGKLMDLTQLTTNTTGVLSLVKGESGTQVPFRVYLRRAGQLVGTSACTHNPAVTEIEIAQVLRGAQPGDELVVDPASDEVGRRLITIHKPLYAPYLPWFFSTNKGKDGC